MNILIDTISESINPLHKSNISSKYKKEEALRILNKYPERVPIIVHRSRDATNTPEIDNHKFLVPRDLTMGQFQYVIRKRLHLSPDKALFLFIENTTPPTSYLVSDIYDSHHDENTLFLFVTYSMENTFG
jgi:GABA(A) receptor-associated protein